MIKKILIIFLAAAISFCFGYTSSNLQSQYAAKKLEEERYKTVFNIGIAIGYLSSKQGIKEEMLYNDGMKMFNMVIK